ncbi:MAG TPA: amidase [Gemmatimonadota bacterium]|nr:amidase [Gemmatimonadota bacterium]
MRTDEPSSREDTEARGLSRRAFVRTTAGGLAAAAVPAGLARGAPDLRRPPGADAAPDGSGAARDAAGFPFEEATIAELQERMSKGDLTAEALTAAYLDRIDALDAKGPRLSQVLQTNPDALRIAAELDRERAAKGPRGPMHGIPVLVKDNIATSDGMETTAGSLALLGSRPPRDAHLIGRLRDAGAVILGKTNLSEWANFRSSNSSSGWSGRGGQGHNPYALDRTPCGSSSGSGAAASASFCAVAVGTETDGSVTCPSNANGLVGIKPTVGLVSRSGIIPISHSQDTAGPMARTVRDAAVLLGAMAGVDPRDAATSDANGHVEADYTRFLDPDGLRGARIGVARKRYWGYNPHADAIGEAALRVLRDAGAVIVDPADIPTAGQWGDSEFEVLLYEFKADLNAYLADLGPDAPVHTLEEVIAFNAAHPEREMPYFGQDIMEKAQAKGPLTEDAYGKALAKNHRLTRDEGIDKVMKEHDLDALVAPTSGPPWLIDLVNGDVGAGGSFTSPAAVAGYPHVTVPAGYAFGLPVGFSFVGTAWSEPTLLKLAYAFERATRARRTPGFRAAADLADLPPGGGA